MHPYFKLKGIEPGRVYTARFGTIDFREEVKFETLKSLFDSGFPYLRLTVEGRKNLVHPKVSEKIMPVDKVKPVKNARKSSKVAK